MSFIENIKKSIELIEDLKERISNSDDQNKNQKMQEIDENLEFLNRKAKNNSQEKHSDEKDSEEKDSEEKDSEEKDSEENNNTQN